MISDSSLTHPLFLASTGVKILLKPIHNIYLIRYLKHQALEATQIIANQSPTSVPESRGSYLVQ